MKKQKTWTFDENEAIASALLLGIKLTNAPLDSELCEAWADRVRRAKACFDDDRKLVIEDDSTYAV
jgi:hypothetical protein